jgi:hypothetical protein
VYYRYGTFRWIIWPLLGAGLVALVLLLVGAEAFAGATADTPAARVPAPALQREPAAGSLDATTTMSHTAYLPLVMGGYGRHLGDRLGVQIYHANDSATGRIVGLGARWVRMPFYWRYIEPSNTTPDQYIWPAGLEAQLTELARYDVSVILTLSGNPSWAATYPAGPIDKVDLAELTEFMQAVVARYSQPPYNVKHWEFYNEPDNGDEYACAEGGVGCFGHEPQAYVDLLQAVYGPMKQADPDAQILFGGIAYNAFDDPYGGPFVRTFLDEVLQRGGANYFDVMNFHYYFAFANSWEDYGMGITGKVNFLRDKLADYGVYKPFVCTETGIYSNGDSSDERQSSYVVQLYARGKSVDLGTMIWFLLVDTDGVGHRLWGLVDPTYWPKPSYYAYQVVNQQLASTTYVQTLMASEEREVYEFLAADGVTPILVGWTNDDQTHDLPVNGDRLLEVEKYGTGTWRYDGEDGQVDGVIHISLSSSPVYLVLQP